MNACVLENSYVDITNRAGRNVACLVFSRVWPNEVVFGKLTQKKF